VKKKEESEEAKQTTYIALKSTNEWRKHYAPEPARGSIWC